MSELLSAGVDLMLLGMVTVFVFLTLLVFGTRTMSVVLNTLITPEHDVPGPALAGAGYQDEQEIAAVAAAVLARHQSETN